MWLTEIFLKAITHGQAHAWTVRSWLAVGTWVGPGWPVSLNWPGIEWKRIRPPARQIGGNKLVRVFVNMPSDGRRTDRMLKHKNVSNLRLNVFRDRSWIDDPLQVARMVIVFSVQQAAQWAMHCSGVLERLTGSWPVRCLVPWRSPRRMRHALLLK